MKKDDHRRIKTEYLFKDMPVKKGVEIANYRLWNMEIDGSRIFGEVMWPNGTFDQPRPLVIFFHGFPGGHRSEDIASAWRRAGCVVICPNHRGAWGSGGKFTVSNCIEDAIAIAKFYHNKKNAKQYNIDPDAIFLAGHSMGGNTSINAARKLKWLKGIILFAPGNMVVSMQRDEAAMDNLLAVGAPMLACDGPAVLKQDLEDHINDYDFKYAAKDLKKMNICLLLGKYDPSVDYDQDLKPLWDKLTEKGDDGVIRRQKTFPCAHGFCNSRNNAIKYSAEFIADLCNG